MKLKNKFNVLFLQYDKAHMVKHLLISSSLLIASHAQAMDLCDSTGPIEDFEEINILLNAPSIKARYELTKNCDYHVETTALVSTSKSLPEFFKQITDPKVNYASANKDMVQEYTVKKNADGSFEQKVKASKNFMTATVTNTCRYTLETSEKIVYECKLKDGGGVLEYNSTIITCSHNSQGAVKCVFTISGKAKNMYIKGPCALAAGGAAETVQGVFRLMEYVTFGSVDERKWVKPGKIFYDTISNNSSSELKQKNFVYSQQIQ